MGKEVRQLMTFSLRCCICTDHSYIEIKINTQFWMLFLQKKILIISVKTLIIIPYKNTTQITLAPQLPRAQCMVSPPKGLPVSSLRLVPL